MQRFVYKVPFSNSVGHQQETVYKLAKLRLKKQWHPLSSNMMKDILKMSPTLSPLIMSQVKSSRFNTVNGVIWGNTDSSTLNRFRRRPQLHQYRPLRSQCSQIPQGEPTSSAWKKWSIHCWINRKSSYWEEKIAFLTGDIAKATKIHETSCKICKMS